MMNASNIDEELHVPLTEQPSIQERLNALETWNQRIESRASRYPAEHQVNSDRAGIYAEREGIEPISPAAAIP